MIFTPHQILFKSRMRWAGHVARMGGGVYWVLVGKHKGKRPLKNPGVDGRIMRRTFRKCVGEAWTGLI